MNITNEIMPSKTRWRAEEGQEYCSISISVTGKYGVIRSYDFRHQEDDFLYQSGNYFKPSEVDKFLEKIKAIFKNRL